MSDESWYIRDRGRVLGPFSFDQLDGMRTRGQLARLHEVSTDRKSWVRATQVPNLFGQPTVLVEPAGASGEATTAPSYDVAPESAPALGPVSDPGDHLAWYYGRDKTPVGPVRFSELRALAARGEVRAETLVWNETLPTWIPAEQVSGLGLSAHASDSTSQGYVIRGGKATGPFTPDQLRSMLDAGLITPGDVCKAPVAVPVPLQQTGTVTVSDLADGKRPGFFLRFAANVIDSLIVTIGTIILCILFSIRLLLDGGILFSIRLLLDGASPFDEMHFAIWSLVGLAAGWLYRALMESSAVQATLGKMACGFRVTDLKDQRISFLRASGRHFGKMISSLTFCIGFLMCAWTDRRQCLHDVMAGCLMVKKR
jgi:uncharacterized RDD family membrane protein YckC